ncbi:MAG: hypothetical protein HQK55_19545 [Deltaproteobacteria bacterium]|nr:hypothetical protein [Deltaproteobacteria bacterium]
MKNFTAALIIILAIFIFLTGSAFGGSNNQPKSILIIQGKVLDPSGNPVADATIMPYHNGKPFLPSGSP